MRGRLTELATNAEESVALLQFRLGEFSLAFALEHVQSVMNETPITPIPHVPRHVRGLMALGQNAMPVLDLARFFRLRPAKRDSEIRRVAWVQVGDFQACIRMPRETRIVRLDASGLKAIDWPVEGRIGEYLLDAFETERESGRVVDLAKVLESARV